MGTVARTPLEQGRVEGEARGIVKGRAEGKGKSLMRLRGRRRLALKLDRHVGLPSRAELGTERAMNKVERQGAI